MGYEPHCVVVDCDGEPLEVVFRTLSKKEYNELVNIPLKNDEEALHYLGSLYTEQYTEIVELAVLWPNPLPDDDLPAGFDRQIAEAVIEASAWVSTERLVEGLGVARDHATSLDGFLKSRIFAAFPTMTVEQVGDMRFTEMMELVAMSETITGIKVDLQPWIDPEGYQKKITRAAKMNKRIMKEQEAGMSVNPKMKDPEFRKKLIAQAQESRERLHGFKAEGKSLDKMNVDLARAKNG